MAVIEKTGTPFGFVLDETSNSGGGTYGNIYWKRSDNINGMEVNKSATDEYHWQQEIPPNQAQWTEVYGPWDSGTAKSRTDQANFFRDIIAEDDRSKIEWYWHTGSTYDEGVGYDDLRTLILGMSSSQSDNNTLVIVFPQEGITSATTPSFCDGGLYWKYDDVADTLSIVLDGTSYTQFTGVTSQADVTTNLETIYLKGLWDYAYNVSTGDICMIFKGEDAGGEVTYSLELEDEITVGDSLVAYIVRPERYRREWSRG